MAQVHDRSARGRQPEAAAPHTARWTSRLAIGGAALVIALLAWHREPSVATRPEARLEDPDACFHARRAQRTIVDGTLLPPVFDAWENFPQGGRAVWPPLHDATLALLARVGGSTSREPDRGMLLACALPVFELMGIVFAVAALARRVGGDRGAMVAAWLAALSPVLARRGAYGEIDHNTTEVLGALLLALFVGWLRSRFSVGWRGVAGIVLLGAGVLLGLGFFAGLALSAALVAGGWLAHDVISADESEGLSSVLAGGFALAAVALPLFASVRVTPDPGDPWRLGPVYVLVLAATALTCAGAALLAQWRRRGRPRSRVAVTVALAAAAVGAALWIVALPAARAGFMKGVGFIGATDRWLSTIDEFQPVRDIDPLLAICPAVLVGIVVTLWALKRGERRILPVAVPFVLLLVLALLQKRFLPLAAAFGAVAAGSAWAFLRAGKRGVLVPAAFALGTLAAAPRLLTYAGETLRGADVSQTSAFELAAAMLRETTPDPGNPPAWGVLAPWDYGHHILRDGARAVALNPFGTFHPGFARAMSIFVDTSPKHALEELRGLRLRYVVAPYAPNVAPQAAYVLGLDPSRFFVGGWSPRTRARYELTPEGERLLAVRLNLYDALPLDTDSAEERLALTHFRKVAQSQEEGPGPNGTPVAFVKLFEILP